MSDNEPNPNDNCDFELMDDILNNSKNKLNLTKDNIDANDEALNEAFNNMNMEGDEDDNIDFNNILGDVMKDFDFGKEVNDNDFGGFSNLLHSCINISNDNNNKNIDFDNITNQLLLKLLDKDIIYEPLLECKKNYEQLVEKGTDLEKNKKIVAIITDMLAIIDKNDKDYKDLLVEKFEELQEMGDFMTEIQKFIKF